VATDIVDQAVEGDRAFVTSRKRMLAMVNCIVRRCSEASLEKATVPLCQRSSHDSRVAALQKRSIGRPSYHLLNSTSAKGAAKTRNS